MLTTNVESSNKKQILPNFKEINTEKKINNSKIISPVTINLDNILLHGISSEQRYEIALKTNKFRIAEDTCHNEITKIREEIKTKLDNGADINSFFGQPNPELKKWTNQLSIAQEKHFKTLLMSKDYVGAITYAESNYIRYRGVDEERFLNNITDENIDLRYVNPPESEDSGIWKLKIGDAARAHSQYLYKIGDIKNSQEKLHYYFIKYDLYE